MTAEQILNEIDDARANVRSVTLRTLKELSHRPASQKKLRRGSAKRPSPVFEDDEVEALMPPASPPDVADVALRELANSPRSQRPGRSTSKAVRKARAREPAEGVAERRRWMQQTDTAVLEANMDDLLEEVNELRQDVDNVGREPKQKGRKSPARKSPGRKSPGRKSPGRKSPGRSRSRSRSKSPGRRQEQPQTAVYVSPVRSKGSIIGELRRAGLAVGMPDTRPSKPRKQPQPDDEDFGRRMGLEQGHRYPTKERARGKEAAKQEEKEAAARDQRRKGRDYGDAEEDELAEPWCENQTANPLSTLPGRCLTARVASCLGYAGWSVSRRSRNHPVPTQRTGGKSLGKRRRAGKRRGRNHQNGRTNRTAS